MLNINSIEPISEIYGPNKRFVIWTQGCNLNCKGCWNKDTWSFKENILYSPTDLLNLILKYKNDIEGITILGGEPLLQKGDLLEFVNLIKEKTDLTIMLYTGFEKSEFTTLDKEIISEIDILIAGRYIDEKRNTFLTWRGSENQKIEFITNKYNKNDIPQASNMVEININPDGSMKLMGYPNEKLINFLLDN
jgi:anaerobic ribonucleoside-triphosphate reductase activating protein